MRSLSGFSLIEVLVAAAIFLIGVTGVVSAVATSSSQRGEARLRAAAADVAQERMELLLSSARGAPELAPDTTHAERRALSGALDATGPLRVSWTVQTLPRVPAASRVRVLVEFTVGGVNREVALETNRD